MKALFRKMSAIVLSLTTISAFSVTGVVSAEYNSSDVVSNSIYIGDFLGNYTDYLGRTYTIKYSEYLDTDFYILSSLNIDEISDAIPEWDFVETANIKYNSWEDVKYDLDTTHSIVIEDEKKNIINGLNRVDGISLEGENVYRIAVNRDSTYGEMEEIANKAIDDGFVDCFLQGEHYDYARTTGENYIYLTLNEGETFTQEMRDEITAMLPYQEYGYTFFERYNYYPVDSQIKCTTGHRESESFVTVYSDYTPIDERGAFEPEPSDGELDMDSVDEEIGHIVTIYPTCLVMTSDLFEDKYNSNDSKVLCDGQYVDINEAILKLEYQSDNIIAHSCKDSYSSIDSSFAVALGREDLVYDDSLNDVVKYTDSVNKISALPYVRRVANWLSSHSDFDYENAEVDTTKDVCTLENEYNFTVLYSKDSEETEDVTETAKVESTTEPTKAETEQTTSQKTEKAEKSPTIVNIDLGDVNGDNSVNSSDAVIVLQDYSNSIITGETALDPDVADVNQDGEVDSIDAVEILKNFAFTIISFE
jgi:hypothetical protein